MNKSQKKKKIIVEQANKKKPEDNEDTKMGTNSEVDKIKQTDDKEQNYVKDEITATYERRYHHQCYYNKRNNSD